MHKHLFLAAALLLSVFPACKTNTKPASTVKSPKLELKKLWVSDTVFTTAESALYDAGTNTIYVSNIENGPWELDGKGSIGKLGLDGKVISARWVSGLNAPKGMAIAKGKLYVADIVKLVEIDLATGKITQKYDVPGCEGLNDVTDAPDGAIYFTDSKKGVVHVLKNGVVSTVVTGLGGSNGILFDAGKLQLGTWKDSSMVTYQLANKKLQITATRLPQPDGIEAAGDGGYFVSSWKGLIHYVHPDGKTTLILDTTAGQIGAADIDYIREKNILLVPTFFKNSVMAYEWVR